MQKGFCLIFIFIVAEVVYANDFYEGDSVVRAGVYAFYNYEFEKAINILEDMRDYFSEVEEYEKCIKILKYINDEQIQ